MIGMCCERRLLSFYFGTDRLPAMHGHSKEERDESATRFSRFLSVCLLFLCPSLKKRRREEEDPRKRETPQTTSYFLDRSVHPFMQSSWRRETRRPAGAPVACISCEVKEWRR